MDCQSIAQFLIDSLHQSKYIKEKLCTIKWIQMKNVIYANEFDMGNRVVFRTTINKFWLNKMEKCSECGLSIALKQKKTTQKLCLLPCLLQMEYNKYRRLNLFICLHWCA